MTKVLASVAVILGAMAFGYMFGFSTVQRIMPADDQALGLAYGCGWTDAVLKAAERLDQLKAMPTVPPVSRACAANHDRALRWRFIQ